LFRFYSKDLTNIDDALKKKQAEIDEIEKKWKFAFSKVMTYTKLQKRIFE
jgi:hypothetical protein